MVARAVIILLLFGLLGDRGPQKGREGNTHFEAERYAAAAATYKDGLEALADTTGAVYTSLQNNRGLTLHRQGRLNAARAAFEQARRTASTDAERVRVLFNAANLAAEMNNHNEALRRYREVLLLDPEHEAARYNYEFLKRRHPDRSADESFSVDPSAYARRLKKKAEALVARSEYTTASALMKDGLQQDSTVRAYRGFIKRIEEVAQIARTDP
jgi:tetratricopeptide (TPR) repeat protein